MIVTGKTPEEIRKTFNIVVSWFYSMGVLVQLSNIWNAKTLAKFAVQNDFTPEEEEEVRKENQWAFE